ncbi:hypothetical protein FACS189461_5210 [Spirochaetia bacterium]|nr:hypothetical protein FACS189461_5210 [Spirochaetia bacterium]
MRKSMSVLFVLLLAVGGATGVFAQSESDFKITTTDGKVTITGHTRWSRNMVIPVTIGGLPVVKIGTQAFEGRKDITSVSIPASVTSIGIRAFSFCSGLTSVSIPASVTDIGIYAFYGCTGLTSVTVNMPANGNIRTYNPLYPVLTAIQVDANDTEYSSRDGVLFNKAGNTLIKYPGGLKGQYAIPASVTSIGDSAFEGCTGLTSVSIPAGVTSIGNRAFEGCTGLTSVSIPAGVTSIGNRAFEGCTGLTSVSISEGITSIGDRAFTGCTGLTSVSIPAGVTTIGDSAFSRCTGLTSISIPASVTSIGSNAFSRCTGLSSVSISSTGTNIDESAFSGCTGLSSEQSGFKVITLGGVGGRVWITGYTGSAVAVIIPATIGGKPVVGIGSETFAHRKDITSVSIPASVTSMRGWAFSGCTGLTSIQVDTNNKNYSSRNGVLFNKAGAELLTYPAGLKGQYAIPTGVTSIGGGAFEGCTGLSSVSIPASVTSIGDLAFYGCHGLTSVSIPEGVTDISYGAFESCTGLVSVSIPASVIQIGNNAFRGCDKLDPATRAEIKRRFGDDPFQRDNAG